jgi:hypothetical protein
MKSLKLRETSKSVCKAVCCLTRRAETAIRSGELTVKRAATTVACGVAWRDTQWGDFRFKPRHGYLQLALTPHTHTACPQHDNELTVEKGRGIGDAVFHISHLLCLFLSVQVILILRI